MKSSTADSSRAGVRLVNHLRSQPRNSVVRLTDCLDMTIVVDLDVKLQIKQTNEMRNSSFDKGLHYLPFLLYLLDELLYATTTLFTF